MGGAWTGFRRFQAAAMRVMKVLGSFGFCGSSMVILDQVLVASLTGALHIVKHMLQPCQMASLDIGIIGHQLQPSISNGGACTRRLEHCFPHNGTAGKAGKAGKETRSFQGSLQGSFQSPSKASPIDEANEPKRGKESLVQHPLAVCSLSAVSAKHDASASTAQLGLQSQRTRRVSIRVNGDSLDGLCGRVAG